MSEIDDIIPIGASLAIDFRFNGEGISTISQSTVFTFYPLYHKPAVEPSQVFYEAELQQVLVSYNHVSPSLSGQYVLCQETTPPSLPSRKRGVEPQESRPRVCGGRLTLTIIGMLIAFMYMFSTCLGHAALLTLCACAAGLQ